MKNIFVWLLLAVCLMCGNEAHSQTNNSYGGFLGTVNTVTFLGTTGGGVDQYAMVVSTTDFTAIWNGTDVTTQNWVWWSAKSNGCSRYEISTVVGTTSSQISVVLDDIDGGGIPSNDLGVLLQESDVCELGHWIASGGVFSLQSHNQCMSSYYIDNLENCGLGGASTDSLVVIEITPVMPDDSLSVDMALPSPCIDGAIAIFIGDGTAANPDYVWRLYDDNGDCRAIEIESPAVSEFVYECADTLSGTGLQIGDAVDITATTATLSVFDGANIPDRVIVRDYGDGTYLAAHCGCWEQSDIAYQGGEDFYYFSDEVGTVNGTGLNIVNDTLEMNLFEVQPDGRMCVDIKAYYNKEDVSCPAFACPDVDLSTLGITESSTDADIEAAIEQYLVDNILCGKGTKFYFTNTAFYYSYNDGGINVSSFNNGNEINICSGIIGNRRAVAVNGNTAFVFSTEISGFFVHEIDLTSCNVINSYATSELGVGANYISNTEILYTTNTSSPVELYILDTTTGISTLFANLNGYSNASNIVQMSPTLYILVAWSSTLDNTLIGVNVDENGDYVNDYVITTINNPIAGIVDVDGLYIYEGDFYISYGGDIYKLNLDGSTEFAFSLLNSTGGIATDFQNTPDVNYEIGCNCCIEKTSLVSSIDASNSYANITINGETALIPLRDKNWIPVCAEVLGGTITLLYDIDTETYFYQNESIYVPTVTSHTVGVCTDVSSIASYDANGNLIVTNADGTIITQKDRISACVELSDGTKVSITKDRIDGTYYDSTGDVSYVIPTGATITTGSCGDADTNGFAAGSGSTPTNANAEIDVRDGSQDMRTANDTYWFDENTGQERVVIDTDDITETTLAVTGKGTTCETTAIEIENNVGETVGYGYNNGYWKSQGYIVETDRAMSGTLGRDIIMFPLNGQLFANNAAGALVIETTYPFANSLNLRLNVSLENYNYNTNTVGDEFSELFLRYTKTGATLRTYDCRYTENIVGLTTRFRIYENANGNITFVIGETTDSIDYDAFTDHSYATVEKIFAAQSTTNNAVGGIECVEIEQMSWQTDLSAYILRQEGSVTKYNQ